MRIHSLALAWGTLLLAGCTQIDTGNVGVERTLGKVKSETLGPGVYFTLFKTVDEFSAKEIPLQLSNLKPKSRDNLTMSDVDVDIYYKINPTMAAQLYTKYQGDVSLVMKPTDSGPKETGERAVGMGRVLREAREAVYRVVATFDATTMHLKRDEITAALREVLQKELNASDPGSFEVTNVNVRSLVTDAALEEAIRQRARVDQQIEAKRKEAELARAEAERKLVEAQGEAAANNVINASLSERLIRMREIAALEALATKQGNTTVLMPMGGAQPLITVK